MKAIFPIALVLAMTTAAPAHDGVKDAQVLARMNLMSMIADNTKLLGSIAKGTSEFDAAIVHEQAEKLAEHSRAIIPLFEVQASDPKSEAKDEIWTDWSGFMNAAAEMEAAAVALGTAYSAEDFQTAFDALGKSCGTCHKDYRIKKD